MVQSILSIVYALMNVQWNFGMDLHASENFLNVLNDSYESFHA